MCRDFIVARARFLECEYRPSLAGLYADVLESAVRCRSHCGDTFLNSPEAISVLANRKGFAP